MASQKDESRNHSLNASENEIQLRILESLKVEHVQGPKTLLGNVGCAQATFYKHLKPLEKKRLVISNKIGREMFYALPQNVAELYDFTRSRTLLEDHVVKNAYRLIDEILRVDPLQEHEMNRISYNCLMLENAVDVLRNTHLVLPENWLVKEQKRISDELTLQRRSGVKRPKPFPRGLSLDMLDWYRHWIEVLQVLEGEENAEHGTR